MCCVASESLASKHIVQASLLEDASNATEGSSMQDYCPRSACSSMSRKLTKLDTGESESECFELFGIIRAVGAQVQVCGQRLHANRFAKACVLRLALGVCLGYEVQTMVCT